MSKMPPLTDRVTYHLTLSLTKIDFKRIRERFAQASCRDPLYTDPASPTSPDMKWSEFLKSSHSLYLFCREPECGWRATKRPDDEMFRPLQPPAGVMVKYVVDRLPCPNCAQEKLDMRITSPWK